MVSRIGNWFSKKFQAQSRTAQPGDTDDGPSPCEEPQPTAKSVPTKQPIKQFEPYGRAPQQREARFSARADRESNNRDSMKQARESNNTDRRRSGMAPNTGTSQMNLAPKNRGANQPAEVASPAKQRRVSITATSQSSLEYEPGELPADFHRKVVDLEIKVEMNGMSQNNNQEQIRMLSDLMQLYSAAIEHYNRTRDEENYSYYIGKLQTLNTDIRSLIEREERQITRMKDKKQQNKVARKAQRVVEKTPATDKPSTTAAKDETGQPKQSNTTVKAAAAQQHRPATATSRQAPQARATSIQPPKLTIIERKKMRINFEMALQTKKQEGAETDVVQAEEERVEKRFVEEREAKKKLEKGLETQKDKMQQRLAERKRSRAMRATSQVHNQTLPLNFGDRGNNLLEENVNDISVNSVQVPMMQTSAMNQSIQEPDTAADQSDSPLKKSQTLKMRPRDDDTMSQGNRSTTTQGGGLANKIGQAVSRILSQTQGEMVQDEDEVADLLNLLNELNAHHDLTVKLSSQSKIVKFLDEASNAAAAAAGSKPIPTVKDYKLTIGKAKSDFGRLGFQSKMRLEMKQMMIDPKVKEVVEQSKQKLEELQLQKDDEIEDFLSEHVEAKYKATMKVKQRFKVQIALATKQKDSEKKTQVEQQQKEELKKVEVEMQEKGVKGKNKIKERFNELAQQVTIDTSEFMNALLKKKVEQKKLVEQQEEVKLSEALIDLQRVSSAEQELSEGDTLESTPTPITQAQSVPDGTAAITNMLDQIDHIDL